VVRSELVEDPRQRPNLGRREGVHAGVGLDLAARPGHLRLIGQVSADRRRHQDRRGDRADQGPVPADPAP
jgi:hypothetical protein